MRILVVYRHYLPDTPPYAHMLGLILARLRADGHEITVLTGQPSYKTELANKRQPWRECCHGIRVRRVALLPELGRRMPLRALNSLLFAFRGALHALHTRRAGRPYDLLWTSSTPPILQGAIMAVAARLLRARYLYHCQDLYPELAHLSGLLRPGLLYRLLRAVDSNTLRHADAVVVLSADMASELARRPRPVPNLHVINNPSLFPVWPRASPAPPRGPGLRIVFAGNLGRFQALEELVDAFGLVERRGLDAELVMLGTGPLKLSLERRAASAGLRRVRFIAHQPLDRAQEIIAGCDLGVVSVRPGIYRAAFPSKTMTYLALGVPVLAIVEPESELARLIEAEGLGHVARGRTPEAVAATIEAVAVDPGRGLPERRVRLLHSTQRLFSPEAVVARWSRLVASLDRH
jgi:colanic acid biosynthesis glycosyl transferase WcaI